MSKKSINIMEAMVFFTCTNFSFLRICNLHICTHNLETAQTNVFCGLNQEHNFKSHVRHNLLL